MEQHNYKFLNYKTYAKFQQDLQNSLIRPDAIVFIQENLRIWARGKEYICSGPGSANASGNSFVFKDSFGNNIFTAQINGNTFALTDADGSSFSVDMVTREELSEKQDALTPGYGISINDGVIGVTLDTSVFTVVEELPTENINPDKIYICEQNEDDVKTYTSYKWDGEQWVPMGDASPSIDLSVYLRVDDANRLYQRKGSYITSSDLRNFSTLLDNIYQRKGESSQGGTSGGNMVALSVSAYQNLIDLDLVEPDTYYFTYEDENWTFGDNFPITLT